jgi:glucose-1-phosphatase
MAVKFIYFDLGNVLVYFDYQVACRQMGAVAGCTPEKVWQTLFDTDLELRYESGAINDQQFYDQFCEAVGSRPDYDQLLRAGSEIFHLNHSMIPIVAQLDAAGYRLGILSNTCPPHWAYCSAGRFGLLISAIDVTALSYQIGACKPDPKIFAAAAKLAGVEPQEIFFVDDIAGHVEGARKAGFDAVQYTTTDKFVEDLLARGVRFNF